MTPERVRNARRELGFTQRQLGEKLRLKPSSAQRTVRRWEDGDLPISGPAEVAVLALLSGFDPDV